ncbi:hypothetical protein BJ742DRAFT_796337 [Cladochytrium replicatum]|nr:hypothetical protein BJ742DRAFT_796337 [Cladochytrium replicatum]
MPQYQAFKLYLEKTEWKVEDVYGASNLLRNRLSLETFNSRLDKLNSEVAPFFAKIRRVTLASRILLVCPFLIVGTLIAFIFSQVVTLTLPMMLSFYILAATTFVSAGVLMLWLRKIYKDSGRRAAEVVKEFAAKDQLVGVNWLHKYEDHSDSKRLNVKQWIEVQVWTEVPTAHTARTEFVRMEVSEPAAPGSGGLVKML